jgi:hypothetical protein
MLFFVVSICEKMHVGKQHNPIQQIIMFAIFFIFALHFFIPHQMVPDICFDKSNIYPTDECDATQRRCQSFICWQPQL